MVVSNSGGDGGNAGRFGFSEPAVEISSYWSAVRARWWLVLAGLVVGGLVGFLAAQGRERYRASAEVYLGDTGLAAGTPTVLGLVSAYLVSESTLRTVATRAHVAVGELQGNVSTSSVLGPNVGKAGASPSALITVTVFGDSARKVGEAATALARSAVSFMAVYPDRQLWVMRSSLRQEQALLTSTSAVLNSNLRLRRRVMGRPGIPATTRQVVIGALSRAIAFEIRQQAQLSQAMLTARIQAALDRSVSPQLTRTAAPVPLGRPGAASGLAVGALIGIVLGLLVAIAWQATTPSPPARASPPRTRQPNPT